MAWVAERKDVLAALFWMLGLAAYLRHVRRPGRGRWLTLVLVFALGLMAKPMLVTLPLVLLILDYWPLGRLRRRADLLPLALEKAPLLALSLVSSALTLKAQAALRIPLVLVPAGERCVNAAISSVAYLGKTLWPSPLSILYPSPPGGPPLREGAAALLALTLASLLVLRLARRRPYLAAGWCWYLVSLVPVSGLVQVGEQLLADRYTYIPTVGVFLAAVWTLRDETRTRPALRALVGAAGVLLLVGWGLTAARYLRTWENSITLCEQALRAIPGNYQVRCLYAGELLRLDRIGEAREQYRQVVEQRPQFAEGHFGLGVAQGFSGDASGAMASYHAALRLKPDHPGAHNNLGIILARAGYRGEAIAHYRAALAAQPNFPEARQNLEQALQPAAVPP